MWNIWNLGARKGYGEHSKNCDNSSEHWENIGKVNQCGGGGGGCV